MEPVQGFAPEKLRDLRQGRGLSVAALADRASVRRSQVWVWEAGATTPTPHSLRALANALQVDPLLLTNTDLMQPTLRDLRLRAGLSRPEVAAGTGISRATVYRLEQGDNVRMSGEMLVRLAAVLTVAVDDVLAGVDRSRR